MKYLSTRADRDRAEKLSLSAAILAGLAPDGGLYVPENYPQVNARKINFKDWPSFAYEVLEPFFKDDPLGAHLARFCDKAFQISLPLVQLKDGSQVLELFHGPTAAFKDFGAQFLAEVIGALPLGKKPRLVLVATSGDTGGAVAAAVAPRAGLNAAIFYPYGGISARQEQQLTCWPDNVTSFAVSGSFDDCQDLVKRAFMHPDWRARWDLLSANSISLGRLLPQMVYFAGISLQHWQKTKTAADFIVPTGNLGNAMAAIWAKTIGFPIERIALATNANRPLKEYVATGRWSPQPSLPTLANAMDVGKASNFERLQSLHPQPHTHEGFLFAESASDADIASTITRVDHDLNYVACPHTATAFYAQSLLRWPNPILVATAHPAKFNEIVDPLVRKPVDTPQVLSALFDLPSRKIKIAADLMQAYEALLARVH